MIDDFKLVFVLKKHTCFAHEFEFTIQHSTSQRTTKLKVPHKTKAQNGGPLALGTKNFGRGCISM